VKKKAKRALKSRKGLNKKQNNETDLENGISRAISILFSLATPMDPKADSVLFGTFNCQKKGLKAQYVLNQYPFMRKSVVKKTKRWPLTGKKSGKQRHSLAQKGFGVLQDLS
jgi:hypothetical protein